VDADEALVERAEQLRDREPLVVAELDAGYTNARTGLLTPR